MDNHEYTIRPGVVGMGGSMVVDTTKALHEIEYHPPPPAIPPHTATPHIERM